MVNRQRGERDLCNVKQREATYSSVTVEGWGTQINYSNITGKREGVFLSDSSMIIK